MRSIFYYIIVFVFYQPVMYLYTIQQPLFSALVLLIALPLSVFVVMFVSAMMRYSYFLYVADRHSFYQSLRLGYLMTSSSLRSSLSLVILLVGVRIIGFFAILVGLILLLLIVVPISSSVNLLAGNTALEIEP